MIGVNKSTLPYQQKLTYPMLKYIRLCRNMSQESFGAVCKIDQSVLAKLERNELQLSPHYENKVLEGCHNLNISELEFSSVKRLTELKAQRG
ncbi:XRE family transcriptional regulator [Bacillus sp. CMF21]|nr:XRE family transcriptional regulator [Bacillus sp. CMF21]